MSRNIIRARQVEEKTTFTRQWFTKLEREGKFPRRVQIGARAVGWWEHEVDAWLEARRTPAPQS